MIINLLILTLMILLTAFFVAAEFGLVKIRRSQLENLSQNGNKKATLALEIVSQLDEYLSACQLGITLTSLAIGWLGEGTVRQLITPVMDSLPLPQKSVGIISLILAFSLITFVHVVIGELIPKSFSINMTEKVVLGVVTPLHYFYKITYPFIWLLNSSANGISKLFGLNFLGEGEETHSQEELLLIANESLRHGEINQDEFEFLNNVFDFDELIGKEIMVTRVDMEVIPATSTVEEALNFAISTGHSRFPVIQKTKDDVIGYVTMQDLIKTYMTKPQASLNHLLQEPISFLETSPVKHLLTEMQKEHKHFAILVDEYGGTSGLVTIEDILEEIVGDIQDERDREVASVEEIGPDEYLVSGTTDLSDIEDLFDVDFPEDNENITIGGFLTDLYQQEVAAGFTCQYQDLKIEVISMNKVMINRLKIKKVVAEPIE